MTTNLLISFLHGGERNINLLVLAGVLTLSQFGLWGVLLFKRRILEASTRRTLGRCSAVNIPLLMGVLCFSWLYPQGAQGQGYYITVMLLTILVVTHLVTTLSVTGIERSSRYVAGIGGVVVSLLLLPSLFSPGVPRSVVTVVQAIGVIAPSFLLFTALFALYLIAKSKRGDLASFRAARSIKVVLAATVVTAVVLVSAPFIMFTTPAEGIAVVWCSAVTCVSGAHAVTERVDFLLEYVRTRLPQIETLSPVQLAFLTEQSLQEATKLLVAPTLANATTEPVKHDQEIVQDILNTRGVEEVLVRRLLDIHAGIGRSFRESDAYKLLGPFLQLSRTQLGIDVIGVSEKLMLQLASLKASADDYTPIILVGEPGVGKRNYSEAIGNLRGVPRYARSYRGSGFDNEKSLVSHSVLPSEMLVVNTNFSDELKEIIESHLNVKTQDQHQSVVICTESVEVAERAHQLFVQSGAAPEVIMIEPLRTRPQDLFCQVIWSYFQEARAQLSSADLQSIELPVRAVLSSAGSRWNENGNEVRDALRVYWTLSKGEYNPNASFVMFEGARNVERLSSWCRNGLAEFFSAQSNPHQIEERLLQRLSVTKQTAQRIISAWMRDQGDHDGVSDYTRV